MKQTPLTKSQHEPVPQKRAHRKQQVLQLADKVFGDQELAQTWLATEILALGGRTPKSLLGTSDGCALVITALEQIAYGAPA